MRYRDFISELRGYIAEAQSLRNSQVTHESEEFRAWRHCTQALVQEAAAHGYRLPGEYRSKSRFYLDPYDHSAAARMEALAKDLRDSEIELQFLVDQFDKYGEPPLVSSSQLSTEASAVTEMDARKPLTQVVRDHWLVGLMVLGCAVAAATWKVASEIAIAPRDQRIQQLQDEVAQLRGRESQSSAVPAPPPAETLSISIGNGGTTSDGHLALSVDSADDQQVMLRVMLRDATQSMRLRVGDRGVVRDADSAYYIDIQRVRGNIVDIVVSKAAAAPPNKLLEHSRDP